MYQSLLETIESLSGINHVDKAVIQTASKRARAGKQLQSKNPRDHFCVFFLPYHKQSNSIFLVHHKKAVDWIPPGGHIEEGEYPELTVFREMQEELSYCITPHEIELFDLSIKQIFAGDQACRKHWDIWYIVHVAEQIEFEWDKREFYGAGWFDIDEALSTMHQQEFLSVINKLNK